MQVANFPTRVPDRASTQRMLNDFAMDLSRHDAQLEAMVNDDSIVGRGWTEWFDKASHQLLHSRDAYMALNPNDGELAARMGVELIDLSQNAGRIATAYNDGDSLASGWRSALDSTIAVVRDASDRLLSYNPQPTPPNYPNDPTDPSYPTDPTQPPSDPTQPPSGPSFPPSGVAADAARAAQLVQRSIDTIRTVPMSDRGDASSKQARLNAYNLNMDAQLVLEKHFTSAPADVVSHLRRADAMLEDANWQLARKPSPDGRFQGVNIPGALRDSQAALSALQLLAGQGAA